MVFQVYKAGCVWKTPFRKSGYIYALVVVCISRYHFESVRYVIYLHWLASAYISHIAVTQNVNEICALRISR